jgi:glyoxylase-like metal-dependent hydrolase (beta-lactamase superfamily II)
MQHKLLFGAFMRVFSFVPKDCFGSNMYILESDGEAVVIDPSVSYSRVRENIVDENIKVKYILITHAHFDDILELEEWVNETKARVFVGEADSLALSDSRLNCYWQFMGIDRGYKAEYTSITDGEFIKFGSSELQAVETPGHSKGSVSFFGEGSLFCGDVLFAGGGFGRVDLPGGDYRILMQSIKKLLALPTDTKVYCGHGEQTSIFQLKTNFI